MTNAQIVSAALINDLNTMDDFTKSMRMEKGYGFCALNVVEQRLSRAGFDTTEFKKFCFSTSRVGGAVNRAKKLTATQIAEVADLVNQSGYNVEAKKIGRYWMLLFV